MYTEILISVYECTSATHIMLVSDSLHTLV